MLSDTRKKDVSCTISLTILVFTLLATLLKHRCFAPPPKKNTSLLKVYNWEVRWFVLEMACPMYWMIDYILVKHRFAFCLLNSYFIVSEIDWKMLSSSFSLWSCYNAAYSLANVLWLLKYAWFRFARTGVLYKLLVIGSMLKMDANFFYFLILFNLIY
jgi:hypothetical protein